MRVLTVGIFEHLGITYSFDVEVRVKLIDQILKGEAMKESNYVLVSCKEKIVEEEGDKWNTEEPEDTPIEMFWDLYKADGLDSDRDDILGMMH